MRMLHFAVETMVSALIACLQTFAPEWVDNVFIARAETARLRVSRVVTVIDAGRILNPLAGRNQIEGAVQMGTILRDSPRDLVRSLEAHAHKGPATALRILGSSKRR